MPAHRNSGPRTLDTILDVAGSRKQDAREAVVVQPIGLSHLEVRYLGCEKKVLISSSTPGITPEPGTKIAVISPGGGRNRIGIVAPVLGGGGSFVTQTQEEEVPAEVVADPEYYALMFDPSDATLVHVHRYALDGSFIAELTTIDFSGFDIPSASQLGTARHIKDVAGVPDGFAVLSVSSGDAFLSLVNLATGTVTQTTLTGVTGNILPETLYVDPAGPFIYAGGVIDLGASPDEHKLFRIELPSLTTIEVGLLPEPSGSEVYRTRGVWLPDRFRLGRSTFGTWGGIDHIFLDPDASPQTGTTTDIMTDEPFSSSLTRSLGNDGVSKAWFAWEEFPDDIKIWELPASGGGAPFGMTDGEYKTDGMQLATAGTFPDNFFWVFFRVFKPPGQTFAPAGAARIARVQFSGTSVSLPTPVDLDIPAAELDQGWLAGEGNPAACLPWFPSGT